MTQGNKEEQLQKWFSIAENNQIFPIVRKLCAYFGFHFLCVEMSGSGLDQATKIKRACTISTGKEEMQLTVANLPNPIPRKHAHIPQLIPKRGNKRAFYIEPLPRKHTRVSHPTLHRENTSTFHTKHYT